jgi:hypothetical protein
MPIRPEMKALYPPNWHEISLAIRERAGQRCEECGVPNYEIGAWADGHWWKAECKGAGCHDNPCAGEEFPCRYNGEVRWLKTIRIVLTVAHLNHDPRDCSPDNLRAWCQRHHNRYDASMRRAGIRKRARAARADGDLLEGGPT